MLSHLEVSTPLGQFIFKSDFIQAFSLDHSTGQGGQAQSNCFWFFLSSFPFTPPPHTHTHTYIFLFYFLTYIVLFVKCNFRMSKFGSLGSNQLLWIHFNFHDSEPLMYVIREHSPVLTAVTTFSLFFFLWYWADTQTLNNREIFYVCGLTSSHRHVPVVSGVLPR